MVSQHPDRRRTGSGRTFAGTLDNLSIIVPAPSRLLQGKVKNRPEFVLPGILVYPRSERRPRLPDRIFHRTVPVQQLTPLAIDLMHTIAIPYRIRPVCRLRRHQRRIRPIPQRLLQVLDQPVGHVDTEPVYALLAPETQDIQEILPDLGVIPVQIRLFLRKRMQVVPSVSTRFPR